MNGDGFDDFLFYGDPQKMHFMPGKGDGTFGAMTTTDEPHDRTLVTEARWQGVNPATLPARGFRSRIVSARVNTDPAYRGLLFATRLDDGTVRQSFSENLPGKKWESTPAYGALQSGPHFDITRESLIVQRAPDAGDAGEVALVTGDASGGFPNFSTRFWPIPVAYIGKVFSAADVDGDGGVDLVVKQGTGKLAKLDVFLAVKGATWKATAVSTAIGFNESGGPCTLKATGENGGFTDVTGDGRADAVCANDVGIVVRAGKVDGSFGDPETTPFEITTLPWNDALLQDIDGDGFRDYVTFHSGAFWYKLNLALSPDKPVEDGHFGGLQRWDLPAPKETTRLLNTFDAAHLRNDARKSAVMVVESAPGVFSLRELASHARQQ